MIVYSRRKLAMLLVADAQNSVSSSPSLVATVVDYMVATKRAHELDLLVRDVKKQAVAEGFVEAEVTTVTTLTVDLKSAIEAKIKQETGARSIAIENIVDKNILGGVKISLPFHELDLTTKHQLNQLMKAYV